MSLLRSFSLASGSLLISVCAQYWIEQDRLLVPELVYALATKFVHLILPYTIYFTVYAWILKRLARRYKFINNLFGNILVGTLLMAVIVFVDISYTYLTNPDWILWPSYSLEYFTFLIFNITMIFANLWLGAGHRGIY